MSKISFGFFSAGLLDLLIGGIVFSFPYMAQSIAAGTLGTVSNTAFAIIYVATCLLLSKYKTFKDQRFLLALGSILFAVGCLILYINISPATLLLAPVIMAIGSATFYPAVQTWFTEGLDRPTTVKVMSGYSIAWVVGYLLGPPVVGFILSEQNFTGLLVAQRLDIILISFSIIGLLLGTSFLPDIFRKKTIQAERQPLKNSLQAADQSQIKTFLVIMWIANFTSFFLTGMVRFMFTELAKAENIDTFIAGNVNVVMFLAVIALSLFLRKTKFWILKFRYLMIIQVLAIPALLFFALQDSILIYFLGSLIFGVISGFTFISSSSYSLLIKENAGKNININEAVVGMGGFLSGLVGYLVAGLFSVKTSFLPGVGLIVLAVILEIMVFRKSRQN